MQVLLGDPVNESTVTMAETIAWQGRQNVTTVKLKVKSKTSKKFKKGISFVFTLVFTALLFNSQFNTAVSQQLNNKLKF